MLGLNPHPRSLKVLHFFDPEMLPGINAREHQEQLERFDSTDYTNVEQHIVHLRLRCNLHPSAKQWSIGEGRQDRRLIAADGPTRFTILRVALGWNGNLCRKWLKCEDCRSQAE